MTIFSLIVTAIAALALGYFLGRSSRNTFILDMKRAVEEEKGRAAGAIDEYKSDKDQVKKLNDRYDALLKEKNELSEELEKSKDEHSKDASALSSVESEKRSLKAELEEIHEVWQIKVDAAHTERDNVLRIRDEEAADWTRKMEEQRSSVDDVATKLKEKNARIDELNALLLDNQKKVDRHDAKYKKEIAKLKAEVRESRKGQSKGSSERKKSGAEGEKTKDVPEVKESGAADTTKTSVQEVSPEEKVGAREMAEQSDRSTAKTDDDELTKIEGIGPKIAEILNGKGITSFSMLSDTPVDGIKTILIEAGPAFRNHSPDTWPEQAAMAAAGRWDELKKWQDDLDGGKEKA